MNAPFEIHFTPMYDTWYLSGTLIFRSLMQLLSYFRFNSNQLRVHIWRKYFTMHVVFLTLQLPIVEISTFTKNVDVREYVTPADILFELYSYEEF
jgi:hypothetical protein